IDISAMAKGIADEIRAANPKRQVEVEIAPGINAVGDQRLVGILLGNLINNAWKFTDGNEAARIAIGREMVDGEARIFVKDNGVGFDMIDSHRLFGAFQRLHSSSQFPVAGIGLLADFAYGMWNGFSEQQHLNKAWQQQAGAARTAPKTVDPSLKRPLDGVDFAIRVPRLDYFAAVKEGIGSGVLYASPGHYPSTRWPGDPGTVGVAAHNVYWINFPQLAKGD